NVKEAQCKEKLGKYCKALKDAELKVENVDTKLKEYCNEKDGKAKDGKCKELEEKIKKKCEAFKNELDGVLKERPIENSNCTQYESQCLFLGACSEEVIGKCSEVRNDCYETKRNKIADEIASRALKGDLKKKENEKEAEEECQKKLKEHCPILGRMSQELMEKCLNPEDACKSLITEAENKCNSLTEKVKDPEKNVNDKTCLPLLEECYFYGPNCKEKDGPECEKLKKECEEKDIIYTPPEEPWFPIQPAPNIADKVGLEELYEATAKKGVFIEKLDVGMEDLIFFLSQKDQKGDFDKDKCEKINKTRCNYLKELVGNSKYNCNDIKGECKKLGDKLKKHNNLEERIQKIKLFNENNGHGRAETIPWHELNTDLNGRNCAQLQLDCFFLSQYNNKLKTACDNIQAMCYKRGFNLVAYETLEDQMRGEFQDFGPNWLNQCQKKLINVCDQVKNQSYHLLALCLHPEETCFSLFNDIRDKTSQLNIILHFTRDSPQEHDCSELEPKCDRLKEEDTELLGPCHTLEKNCRHLRESQQLRDLLLGEKKNLSDITHCGNEINDKCHHYSRKID
ncbi:hypothetical protein PCK2_000923, partial [Pneumocystis canis]